MEIHLSKDYITVLVVRYPRNAIMTKRLYRRSDGTIDKLPYDDALKFDVQKHPIEGLGDLAEILGDLRDRPDRVVIRGLPAAGHYNVYRRIHGDKAAFKPDPEGHHWFMADFDEVPLPLFLEPDDDPEILLGYLVRLLPAEFHNASYYWQWSCGQGLDGGRTLRAHIWFWVSKKHSDRAYENWAKWVNGTAGWKVLDLAPLRTVQPNYTASPVIGDDVDNPVHGFRAGVYIGAHDEVAIEIPTLDWEEQVRQEERQEYEELVDYGFRQTYGVADRLDTGDQYEVFLRRIGDDKDGFHDPMTRAIWHWARAYSADLDEEFKAALRAVVRSAKCTKQRDLDEYLADYRLDASLKGAREKCGLAPHKSLNALERYRARIAHSLSHSEKGLF